MKQNEKEIIRFSVLGKNSKTQDVTLSVRKEAELLESLRTDTQSGRLSKLRKSLAVFKTEVEQIRLRKNRLPEVCAGCRLQRTNNGIKMKDYNGIVTLVIALNETEVQRTKEQLAQLPQVRAVFIGYDCRSIVVLLRFVRPDGTLPTESAEIKRFHAAACQMSEHHIRPYLPVEAAISNNRLPKMTFQYTLDKELFYNPDATPVLLRQPPEIPTTIPLAATTDKKGMRSSIMEQQRFIQQHYDIRYNVIKEMLEYRRRDEKENGFKPLDTIAGTVHNIV